MESIIKNYQKEIVTGLIVGAIILLYINRNYIQSVIRPGTNK